MRLSDLYALRAADIALISEDVRAEARRTGTAISYTEAAYGIDVIREFPDARRERTTKDGTVVVMPPVAR